MSRNFSERWSNLQAENYLFLIVFKREDQESAVSVLVHSPSVHGPEVHLVVVPDLVDVHCFTGPPNLITEVKGD